MGPGIMSILERQPSVSGGIRIISCIVHRLQRAFLVAGADAVLMSLWKVDDEAARDFMIEFYSKWLSGLNKREAYDAAVSWMKTKYPAPFYWGAFVLVGAS